MDLDMIGVYDPITRLGSMGLIDDFAWDLCALEGPVVTARGVSAGIDSGCTSSSA